MTAFVWGADLGIPPAVVVAGWKHIHSAWYPGCMMAGFTADTQSYHLGQPLTFSGPGRITHLVFWRQASDPTTSRILRLWDRDTTTKVAEVTSAGLEAGVAGWVKVPLPAPFTINPAHTYVTTYEKPVNQPYAAYSNYLWWPMTNGPVAAIDAGVFTTSNTAMPTESFNHGCYFVDAVFESDVVAPWTNRVIVVGPRNGTTTHTIDPASATNVRDGTPFTPTAGRLLVCVADGGVTSTTPAGWTLPANGSAISNTGLYVWWKIAAGGGADMIATTHNGANYPVSFAIYEFPVGSTFGIAAKQDFIGQTNPNPTLSGLAAAPKLLMAAKANGIGSGGVGQSVWSAPTLEDIESYNPWQITDGSFLSVGVLPNSALTSYTPTCVYTGASLSNGCEGLTWSVNVAA